VNRDFYEQAVLLYGVIKANELVWQVNKP